MTGPRILYLTHRVPYPPNRGDRIRTFHILKFLASRARVSLACLAEEPLEEGTLAELHRHCERVAVVPVEKWLRWGRAATSFLRGRTVTEGVFQSPRLKATVRAWAQSTGFHATLASSSGLASLLQLEELRDTPAYVDLIDVDSQKWLDYADSTWGPRSWFYHQEGRRLRRHEKQLATWTGGLSVVSEPEAELYQHFCPDGPIHAIPNGVDIDYFHPRVNVGEDDNACVFVGALDYKPNVDGITWFCHNVWPGIRQQHPQATLQLVGREPVQAVVDLAKVHGVDVIGTVPDVRPYLAKAAVAVVPLQIARGVQNKVLEALAMAKAVVASPQPLVGLDTESGAHLLAVDTERRWVESVVGLMNDPAHRQELGLAGCAYVMANHRWGQCLEPFARLLQLPPTDAGRTRLPDIANTRTDS